MHLIFICIINIELLVNLIPISFHKQINIQQNCGVMDGKIAILYQFVIFSLLLFETEFQVFVSVEFQFGQLIKGKFWLNFLLQCLYCILVKLIPNLRLVRVDSISINEDSVIKQIIYYFLVLGKIFRGEWMMQLEVCEILAIQLSALKFSQEFGIIEIVQQSECTAAMRYQVVAFNEGRVISMVIDDGSYGLGWDLCPDIMVIEMEGMILVVKVWDHLSIQQLVTSDCQAIKHSGNLKSQCQIFLRAIYQRQMNDPQ